MYPTIGFDSPELLKQCSTYAAIHHIQRYTCSTDTQGLYNIGRGRGRGILYTVLFMFKTFEK